MIQIKEKHKFYCGPWWMPRWLRRILSFKFNASCKVHDLDYASREFSRIEADDRFLLHMIRQAKSSLFWEIYAMSYYILVRILGKLSWDKDQ